MLSRQEAESLYSEWEDYAELLAHRAAHSQWVREELEQEARIACWRAALDYDPAKAKFITFLTGRVRGAIQHWMRDKFSVIKLPAWQFDKMKLRPPVVLELDASSYEYGDERHFHCDEALDIESAMEWMDERSRTIIAQLADGHTQTEIANMNGLSQITVSRIIRRKRQYLAARLRMS